MEFIGFLTVSTTIGRERPDVTPLGSVPSTSSFPSGHVAAGVVLYGGLVLIAASITGSNAVARRAAIPAAVVIACVASARVYEGVHHPSDVIGGAVLGMGALLVAAVSTGLVVPTRRATGVRPPVGRRRRGGDAFVIVAGVAIGVGAVAGVAATAGAVAVVAERPDRPAPRTANRPAFPSPTPARHSVSLAAIIRSRRRPLPRRWVSRRRS